MLLLLSLIFFGGALVFGCCVVGVWRCFCSWSVGLVVTFTMFSLKSGSSVSLEYPLANNLEKIFFMMVLKSVM